MSPNPPSPAVGRTGARFGRAPHTAAVTPQTDAPTSASPFETSRHGYDRDQVDVHMARHKAEIERLRGALAAAEHTAASMTASLAVAEQHTCPSEGGFGARAEKILRLAEAEATEVRTRASRDASELTERARADAEQYRHETEQTLIRRAAETDEANARSVADLREQQERIAGHLDAVRIEADRITGSALRDADRIRHDGEQAADDARSRLRAELDRMQEGPRTEIDRLARLHAETVQDLQRITDLLVAEVPAPTQALAPPDAPVQRRQAAVPVTG